ncbi:MAG: hypothetical protein JWM57_1975 [Phycisphaerales bacterium]|nr:hypothetical protein [Phycisphaerales bacterium]
MNEKELDADGQPNEAFGWARRRDSGTDELIGLCRGVLADERLNFDEAKFIHQWLLRNPPVLDTPYGIKLHDALECCLDDGVLTDDEEDRLIDLLLRFTGGTPENPSVASGSTRIPLCDPQPTVLVAHKAFCFTGTMTSGTRLICEQQVLERMGLVHKSPTLKTGYLVIGDLGSRDWVHSNSGRKIEKAVEYRDRGCGLCIISEGHWTASLGLG